MKCLLSDRLGKAPEQYEYTLKVSDSGYAHGAACIFCDGITPDHGLVPTLMNIQGRFAGAACALCLVRAEDWYRSVLMEKIAACRSVISNSSLALGDCSPESSRIDELGGEAGMLEQWCEMLGGGIGLDEAGLDAFLSSNGIAMPVRGAA